MLALLLTTSPAWASKKAADALFQEGRGLLSAGDFAGACKKFEESKDLSPAAVTVLNLGLCHEKQGKYILAVEHYKNAALAFRSGAGHDDANRRAAEAERQIARLILTRDPELPKGARVSLDGNRVNDETLDTKQAIDPGEHTVEVDVDGHQREVTTLTLAPGEELELTVVAGPLEVAVTEEPSSAAPASSTKSSSGSPLRTAGLVLGGVGLASVIVGGVTGVIALNNASIYRDSCEPNPSGSGDVCSQRGLDAAGRVSTFAPVSTIAFIAGGALVAGGVTLFLLAPKGSKSTGALQITPAVGPTMAGASLSYRFQ